MRRYRVYRVSLAVVTMLVVAGACADGPSNDNGAGGQVSPPSGASELVLRFSELPGMLPPGGTATVPPSFSVYGDGRLITAPPAGTAALWPVLGEHQVPADGVRQVVQAAVATGLLDGRHSPGSPYAGPDAPAVVVTLVSAGKRYSATLPRSDRAVARLKSELTRYAAGPGSPYRPAAVAVIANPTGVPHADRAWPLGSLDGPPLSGTGAGSRCTVLRGPGIDTAYQAAATATPATTWASDSRAWTVGFRPLLPDEPDCTAL